MVNKRKSARTVPEPRVGIFWFLHEKLLFDATPISQAEDYGDFRVHHGDHISVWATLQMAKAVPAEMEYEEAPRGRIVYHVQDHRFTLFADPCILRQKRLVTAIKKEMHLPHNTATSTDSHYQCFRCLGRILPE